MGKDFFTAIKDRRTYYGISKETLVSDQRIQEIINEAVNYYSGRKTIPATR